MSALRRIYVMGGGGGGGASDEETPHRRHRHLHHHHHDKKDYTVTPTGGNVPVKIPSEEEARRPRHRRRRDTTAPAPQENGRRRVIDPELEPGRSPLRKRSSGSSIGTSSSDSSVASTGGIEIQENGRRHGGSRECPTCRWCCLMLTFRTNKSPHHTAYNDHSSNPLPTGAGSQDKFATVLSTPTPVSCYSSRRSGVHRLFPP